MCTSHVVQGFQCSRKTGSDLVFNQKENLSRPSLLGSTKASRRDVLSSSVSLPLVSLKDSLSQSSRCQTFQIEMPTVMGASPHTTERWSHRLFFIAREELGLLMSAQIAGDGKEKKNHRVKLITCLPSRQVSLVSCLF